MPRIFDNLTPSASLAPALQETLSISNRADFCVGYFNLRGWGDLAPYVDRWNPEDGPCRLLIGMQRLPNEELREALAVHDGPPSMDNATAHRLRVQLAEQLRQHLTFGLPTNADEAALHRLTGQLKAKRVIVKLFLRHPLHAKLYLLFRDDPNNPITGYLGSSNLTFAGLSQQGELNVDVLDHDATGKLRQWFEDRWNDRYCVDITDELLEIIEESWARQDLVPPYHLYLKMAYHLSNEARAGIEEFKVPSIFGDRLFEFQTAAVKIAAHHLNRRNGVLVGDVVGLGKTLIATVVARIFGDDLGTQTLIICPKNLVRMWEEYRDEYGLRARVLSISRVLGDLPNLRRYHQVIIDESHNLVTATASAIGRSTSTSARTRAGASCFRPRRTTRPITTFPTNCGFSSARNRTWEFARSKCCATWAKLNSGASIRPTRAAWPRSSRACTPTTGAT